MKLTDRFRRLWTTPPRESWRDLMGRLPDAGPERFVWCLSTGRTGTQTLAALVALSPHVAARHEPAPKLFRLSQLAYESGSPDIEVPVFSEAVHLARPHLTAERARAYVETSPQLAFLGPALLSAFPSSYFVHLTRHPVAVVRSGLRRDWYAGNRNDDVRIRPRADAISGQWAGWSQIRKIAWLWAETNRTIAAFLDEIDAGRWIRVKSEELFAGEADALRALYEMVGAPVASQSAIDDVLSAQLNRQVSGAAVAEFETWPEADLADLRSECDDVMKLLGYAFDRAT